MIFGITTYFLKGGVWMDSALASMSKEGSASPSVGIIILEIMDLSTANKDYFTKIPQDQNMQMKRNKPNGNPEQTCTKRLAGNKY